MRKFFCALILPLLLLVGGCNVSKNSIQSTDTEIKISAENVSGKIGEKHIKIPDGASLQVESKISAGKLIIGLDGKEHTVDMSGETFIDAAAGERELFFSGADGLTGEIILRALPKI